MANLLAKPEFLFCLKESVRAQLTAKALPIRDPVDRRLLMTASQTIWCRNQMFSVEELVSESPIVDVEFPGDFDLLNRSRFLPQGN